MPNCIVPGCSSCKYTNGISFHRLPKDHSKQQKWCRAIFGDNSNVLLKGNECICSKHFLQEHYSISTTNKILLPDAVPIGVCNVCVENIDEPKTVQDLLPSAMKICSVSAVSEDLETVNIKRIVEESESYSPKACHSEGALKYSIGMQCDTLIKNKVDISNKMSYLSRKAKRLQNRVIALKSENKSLKSMLKNKTERVLSREVEEQVFKIVELSMQDDMRTNFLLEQIRAFGKQKVKYSDTTIMISRVLAAKSPECYKLIQDFKILNLPSTRTLQNHTAHLNGKAYANNYIKDLLQGHCEPCKPSLPESVPVMSTDAIQHASQVLGSRQPQQGCTWDNRKRGKSNNEPIDESLLLASQGAENSQSLFPPHPPDSDAHLDHDYSFYQTSSTSLEQACNPKECDPSIT